VRCDGGGAVFPRRPTRLPPTEAPLPAHAPPTRPWPFGASGLRKRQKRDVGLCTAVRGVDGGAASEGQKTVAGLQEPSDRKGSQRICRAAQRNNEQSPASKREAVRHCPITVI